MLDFVHKLEAACIETVEAGKMTKDLAILTHGPKYVTLVVWFFHCWCFLLWTSMLLSLRCDWVLNTDMCSTRAFLILLQVFHELGWYLEGHPPYPCPNMHLTWVSNMSTPRKMKIYNNIGEFHPYNLIFRQMVLPYLHQYVYVFFKKLYVC